MTWRSTGLLGIRSRASGVLCRVPEERIDTLVKTDSRRDFRTEFINARSYRSTEDQIGRDFDRAENYLSLVGLIIVILGGIAVSSVTRVFILQKDRSIAVLSASAPAAATVMADLRPSGDGARAGRQPAGRRDGAAGTVGGHSDGARLLDLDSGGGALRRDVERRLQGIGIGVLVSLLFSVVPLLQVRFIKPSLLLRDEVGAGHARLDPVWPRLRLVTASLVGVAAMAGGLAAGRGSSSAPDSRAWRSSCSLAGRGRRRARGAARPRPVVPAAPRVLHLSRPGNQTRVILLAVGLGAFFIVGVRSLQASLLDEFSVQVSEDAPTCSCSISSATRSKASGRFWRIRRTARVSPADSGAARPRGRRDRPRDEPRHIRRRPRARLAREYTITYRDHLESNERIVEGAFWNGPSTEPEVSVEQGIHERFAINVGDTVRFDMLGRVVTARVTSIRDVEWRESRNGGFMFVFRPGVLEQAPQTYVAPLKGPARDRPRARGSSTTWSSGFPTSRSSTSTRSSRPSATSCRR